MNWEIVAALGEIVGAAAVVMSLLYLSRQVRTSNRLAEAEAWRSSTHAVTSLNAAFGVNPRFDQLVSRVMQGDDVASFEIDDASIMTAYMASVGNVYEQVFREVRSGVLDQRALEEFFVGRFLFESPFFRTKWSAFLKHLWSDSFVEWVERTHDMRLPGKEMRNFPAEP